MHQTEVASTLTTVWLLVLPISFFFKSASVHVFLWGSAMYILASQCATKLYLRYSRKVGLRYFYLMPISNRLLHLLIRNRLPIPTGRKLYTVHVQENVRRDSPRHAIADMLADLKKLRDQSNDVAFVGNTFAEFGTRQFEWMCQHATVVIAPGTFLPAQTLLFTKRKLRDHQKQVLGRAFPFAKLDWKIMIVCPFEI